MQSQASLVGNFWDDERAKQFFTSRGASFISAWGTFCNAEGCLVRMEDGTLSTFDSAHLSEKAAIFLIAAISDQILGHQLSPRTESAIPLN